EETAGDFELSRFVGDFLLRNRGNFFVGNRRKRLRLRELNDVVRGLLRLGRRRGNADGTRRLRLHRRRRDGLTESEVERGGSCFGGRGAAQQRFADFQRLF